MTHDRVPSPTSSRSDTHAGGRHLAVLRYRCAYAVVEDLTDCYRSGAIDVTNIAARQRRDCERLVSACTVTAENRCSNGVIRVGSAIDQQCLWADDPSHSKGFGRHKEIQQEAQQIAPS